MRADAFLDDTPQSEPTPAKQSAAAFLDAESFLESDEPAMGLQPVETGSVKPGLASNAFRNAGERGMDLIGNALQMAGQLVESGEQKITDALGGFNPGVRLDRAEALREQGHEPDFEIGGYGVDFTSRLNPQETDLNLHGAGQAAEDVTLGYQPNYTIDKAIDEPTIKNIIGAAAENGPAALADMAALIISAPAYLGSRTQEIAEARVENNFNNMHKASPELQRALLDNFNNNTPIPEALQREAEQLALPGWDDYKIAGPAAAASVLVDRLALGKLLPGGANAVTSLRQVPGAAGRAFVTEGVTEAGQEGGIEYLGEAAGTKKGWNSNEAGRRALGGLIVGGPTGATMRGATATYEATRGASQNPAQDATPPILQDEVQDVPNPVQDQAVPVLQPTDDYAPVNDYEGRPEWANDQTNIFRDGVQPEIEPAPQAEAQPLSDDGTDIDDGTTGQAADDLSPYERNQLREAGVTDEQLWDMPTDEARQQLNEVQNAPVVTPVAEAAAPSVEPVAQSETAEQFLGEPDAETVEAVEAVEAEAAPEPAPQVEQEAPVAAEPDAAAEIDVAAAETDTNPTEAQKEAGNYKKAKVRVHGLDIAIENPKGSTRSGTDPNGKKWESEMAHHYGYIKRTEGADGDHVDVFIGPDVDSDRVFVIDQVNADGSFDEHKVVLGFKNQAAARKGYRDNYDKDWKVGPTTKLSVDEFKTWLKEGDTTKPLQADKVKAVKPAPQDGVTITPSNAKDQGLYGWRKPRGGEGYVYSIQRDGKEVGFLDLAIMESGEARIMDVVSNDGANSIGAREVRRLMRKVMELHPGITEFTGERVSGIRRGGRHGFEGSGEEVKVSAKPKAPQKNQDWLGVGQGETVVFSGDVGYAKAGTEYTVTKIDRSEVWVKSSEGGTNLSRADIRRAQVGGVTAKKVEPKPAEPVEQAAAEVEQTVKPAKWARRDKRKLWDGPDGMVIADHSMSVGGTKSKMFMVFASNQDYMDGNNFATGESLAEAKKLAADGPSNTPKAETKPAPEQVAAKESAEPQAQIDDFGEKLEGARKDVMAAYREKLDRAGDVDTATVPLSKSWPEPNYQKMLGEGVPADTVALIRALRDEVPTKPQKSWKLKGWVEMVNGLRDMAGTLMEDNAVADKVIELMKSNIANNRLARESKQVMGRMELYQEFGHADSFKGVTFGAAFYQIYNGEKNVTIWEVERQSKATAFGNMPRTLATGKTREEALANLRKALDKLPESTKSGTAVRFNIYRDRYSNDVFIGKKVGKDVLRLKTFDDDVKAAREYLANNQEALEQQLAKMKEIPSHRRQSNSPRVGVDHRKGGDVTPEAFAETFGFRGVQFGNYVEQGRRQADLNQAYDALMDLAGILDIPAKALSLNGELGLAFGARGKGGKNSFAAHYESGQIVINLTKKSGAGSLAHEWWHSLDNYFGRERGARSNDRFATDNQPAQSVRPEVIDAFRNIRSTVNSMKLKQRSKALDKVRTKAYWSTTIEMTARSFESYVIERLKDQGASNDYLANIVSEEYWKASEALGMEDSGSYPYPEAAEIPQIRAAYDHFFDVVDTQETEDGNIALYSREGYRRTPDAIGQGLSKADAQAHVDTLMADWKGKPEVIVARRIQEFPEGLRLAIGMAQAENDMRAVYWGDKVYVLAPRIGSTQALEEVILHEVIGHYGLRKLLGADLKPVLHQVYLQLGKTQQAQQIKQTYYPGGKFDSANTNHRLTVAEELIAHIAETGKHQKLWAKVVAAIRAGLRKLGFTLDLNENDVLSLLRGAQRVVEQGGYELGADSALNAVAASRYSRTEQPSVINAASRFMEKQNKNITDALLKKAQFVYREGITDQLAAFDRNDTGGDQSLSEVWLNYRDQLEGTARAEADAADLTFSELADQYKRDIQEALDNEGGAHLSATDLIDFAGRISGEVEAFLDALSDASSEIAFKARSALSAMTASRNNRAKETLVDAADRFAGKPVATKEKTIETFTEEEAVRHVGGFLASEIPYLREEIMRLQVDKGETPSLQARRQLNKMQAELDQNMSDALYLAEKYGYETMQDFQRAYLKQPVIDLPSRKEPEADSKMQNLRDRLERAAQDIDNNLAGLLADQVEEGRSIDEAVARERDGNMEVLIEAASVSPGFDPNRITPLQEQLLEQYADRMAVELKRRVQQMVGDPANSDALFSRQSQTQTNAFKRWFGDSKVVDENGEPLVVYHGSRSEFNEFEAAYPKGAIGNPKGIYFDSDREVAEEYAANDDGELDGKSRVIAAYVRVTGNDDGIIRRRVERGKDQIEVVAFDPAQIKSATGNSGTFDPDTADIRFSRAPDLDPQPFGTASDTLVRKAVSLIADKFTVLKGIQQNIEATQGEIAENANAYQAEELFHGKVENDLRLLRENMIEPMAKKMSEYGVSLTQLDEFLYAMHAPERNRVIAQRDPKRPDGGSGMTNAEAAAIINKVDQDGKLGQYKELAAQVHAMLAKRREILNQNGLLDDETRGAWEETYRFYVPLKGHAADEKQTSLPRTGKGFAISGPESKMAAGRKSKAASPVANAVSDLTEAVLRHRKNEVGNAFLKLVHDHPNADLWQIYTADNPEVERKAVKVKDPATGKTKIEVRETVVPMAMMQDRYFTTKVKGNTYYIKIEDPRLMKAMKNIGPDNTGLLVKSLSAVTRLMSSLNTSYNPEFVISNFSRDIQTALMNLSSEQSAEGGKVRGKAIVAKTLKDVPFAIRAINASLKSDKTLTGRAGEYQRYFDEFRAAGAKTGWFDMKDLDGQMADLETMVKMASGGFANGSRRAFNAVTDWVEHTNSAIENGVRLAAYVNAREAGISRAKAASLAKNMTVNFNRRGELGTTMNALYMFANASVQGTANFVRTLGRLNGKKGDKAWSRLNTAHKIAVVMATGGFTLSLLNRLVAGEDDDGENWWDKVPDYVKERNIVIMDSLWGGEPGKYTTIPLPYGYNIFPLTGLSLEHLIFSDKSAGQIATNLTLGALGSFSPIGFEDSDELHGLIGKNVAPTVLKPVVSIGLNENFMGGPLYKENFSFGTPKPDSALAFRSTAQVYKELAKGLNDLTGGSEFRSGAIDLSPDVMDYLVGYYGGGAYDFFTNRTPNFATKLVQGVELEDREVPFKRKVRGEVLPYEDQSKFYDRRDEINQLSDEKDALTGADRVRFIRDYGDKLRLEGVMKASERRLKVLRKKRDRIEVMDDLSAAEKDAKLQEVQQQMKRVFDQFNRRYNELDD